MQSLVNKICRAALVVSALTLVQSVAAQTRTETQASKPSRERVLLGVRLRPEMAAWLEEVEGKLGKEVYAEFAPLGPEEGEDGFVGGENYVTERGTAVLRLNQLFQSAGYGKRLEATLAHELLHLRQRVRGFPAYALDEAASSPRVPLGELDEMGVAGGVMEAVEHQLILPEMRRMNLDTAADMIGGLAWAKQRGVSPDHPSNAIYYLRATFEYGDAKLLEELKQAYRRNRWTRALGRGERMAQLVRSAPLRTPADMTAVVLRCLTELFGGIYQFTARPAPARVPRDRIFPTIPIAVRRVKFS